MTPRFEVLPNPFDIGWVSGVDGRDHGVSVIRIRIVGEARGFAIPNELVRLGGRGSLPPHLGIGV